MIIKYSNEFVEAHEKNIFSYIKSSWIENFISYCINSLYRKSVTLKNWLEEQVKNPSSNMLELSHTLFDDELSYDEQMHKVFLWIRKNVNYVSDINNWNMNEYWETAEEVLDKKKCDCEGGSIFMYVLARLVGIPSDRLMIFTGWVNNNQTGHCYLGYKPYNYPHNFVILDWCYYPNNKKVIDRNLFYIKNKKIIEYKKIKKEYYQINSLYNSIWFAFNENISMTNIKEII